jgi:hypothetical protein
MTLETLLPLLTNIKATEFSRIALACELSDANRVIITYAVAKTDVSVIFKVAQSLVVEDAVLVNGHNEILNVNQLTELNEKLATEALYGLVRRYLFLQNASQRDESLAELFSADAKGQASSIEFYPLMNLMTAYYEGH